MTTEQIELRGGKREGAGRPTISKMSTEEKKQAFIENYKTFKYITKTCKAIGVSYSKYYEWLGDEVFSKASNAIKKEIDTDRLDRYEAELDNRALGGASKQSDILLIFGLKALNPGRYRDQVAPLIGGDIKLILAIPGHDESLRLNQGNIIEGEIVSETTEHEGIDASKPRD